MLLSIIAAGKNDGYAGNFMERLQFNIEKLNANLKKMNVTDVEIIVVDWSSNERLSDVMNTENFEFTKFLYVNPESAKRASPDNGFSSVHALNSGARRSEGKYVFFIDGDSYLSLHTTTKLYELCRDLDKNSEEAYFWATRYHLPYEIHSNCKTILELDSHIDNWVKNNKQGWSHQKIDINNVIGPMGLMLSRKYVNETTCYYEKLNKWGYIEIEFSKRVRPHIPCNGDLEDLDMFFFHLDHHSIGTQGKEKKANPNHNAPSFKANGDEWGLINENLEFYKV